MMSQKLAKAFLGNSYTHILTRVHKKQIATAGYIFLILSIVHGADTFTYKLPIKSEGLTVETEKEIAELAYQDAIKQIDNNGKAN